MDREHKDLYNRLLYLEKNIETLRKVIGEWEKKSDDAKKLQLDKESQLRECANNIRRLENEIDDLNKLIDEKEGLIDVYIYMFYLLILFKFKFYVIN